MNPKQVCAKAAEIIQRDGWHQGDFFPDPDTSWVEDETPEGYASRQEYEYWLAETSAPVCAMGAIRRAVTGSGVMDLHGPQRGLVQAAAQLLAETLDEGH